LGTVHPTGNRETRQQKKPAISKGSFQTLLGEPPGLSRRDEPAGSPAFETAVLEFLRIKIRRAIALLGKRS
jgi:hypothetical protein